jgi:hypothetical protein
MWLEILRARRQRALGLGQPRVDEEHDLALLVVHLRRLRSCGDRVLLHFVRRRSAGAHADQRNAHESRACRTLRRESSAHRDVGIAFEPGNGAIIPDHVECCQQAVDHLFGCPARCAPVSRRRASVGSDARRAPYSARGRTGARWVPTIVMGGTRASKLSLSTSRTSSQGKLSTSERRRHPIADRFRAALGRHARPRSESLAAPIRCRLPNPRSHSLLCGAQGAA